MDIKEFKSKVHEILNKDVKFDGHVGKIISELNENRLNSILIWIEECRNDKHRCIQPLNEVIYS